MGATWPQHSAVRDPRGSQKKDLGGEVLVVRTQRLSPKGTSRGGTEVSESNCELMQVETGRKKKQIFTRGSLMGDNLLVV